MIEPWLPASATQNEIVTDAAGAATGRFVAGGYRTIYDGVVGPWFVDRFLTATGIDGADYAIVLPPVEVCLQRVAMRLGHGFRDAPAAAKMHHEFAAATIDGRHVIDNPAARGRRTGRPGGGKSRGRDPAVRDPAVTDREPRLRPRARLSARRAGSGRRTLLGRHVAGIENVAGASRVWHPQPMQADSLSPDRFEHGDLMVEPGPPLTGEGLHSSLVAPDLPVVRGARRGSRPT